MSKIEVNAIEPQCGTTLTLGASGDTVTLGSGASQSGFGRSGSVDWQTGSIKTANFTAANGEGYFCNTSGGAFTATLPASPSAGDIVSFSDYTRTFATNNLTIGRNSEPIGGVSQDAILSTNGQTATFVYVDGTEGWINVQETSNSVTGRYPFIVATGGTVTTCGNCKIHTFTGPGTFTVCAIAAICAPTRNNVSYMVVAGGGGGGGGEQAPSLSPRAGGGGGAGGFREYKAPLTPYTASPLDGNPGGTSITVTATAFPITVGGGGAKSPMPITDNGSPGTNSIFSTVTSAGGGGGGSVHLPGPVRGAESGGSGGGGSSGGGSADGSGGAGNTPPVSPPQGQPGGSGNTNPGQGGDGGGGATAAGAIPSPNPSPNTAGANGGAGATTSISTSSTTYAGGGGGGGGVGAGGSGGSGGGGAGGNQSPPLTAGQNGTANTGGGAGGGAASGGANHCAGVGGSGIVIIRYKYQ